MAFFTNTSTHPEHSIFLRSPLTFVAPQPSGSLFRFTVSSSSLKPASVQVQTFQSPSRRARFAMHAGSLPSPSPKFNGDDDLGDSVDPGNNEPTESFPQQIHSSSDQNLDNVSEDALSTPAETMFSEEVLRRRIAQLSDRSRQHASTSSESANDTVLDLSLAFDDSNSEAMIEIGAEPISSEDTNSVISAFEGLNSIWVIMFTNTKNGSDGLYSLTIDTENIVLGFENKQEAHRYAICLEAQNFPSPQVCDLDPDALREFCLGAKIKLGFVPAGVMLVPPDESAVEDLDSWKGRPSSEAGMSDEDIDTMKRRFDSLFGQ